MHTAVYWFGFLGAWLLFAGPVFQASVELRAEDEASERMHHLSDGLPPPPRVSNWWWLLPPVRLVLSSRRSKDYRESVLAALSTEDLQLITRYLNIARGWMLVGLGACSSRSRRPGSSSSTRSGRSTCSGASSC